MHRTLTWIFLIGISACGGPSRGAGTGASAPVCEDARVIAKLPKDLNEVSGIAISARHPGIFWVHNDDGPAIFAIDSTGTIKAIVRVTGVRNRDWEDIAVAPCGGESCLFIADVGDNTQNAKRRRIYRILEPALEDTATSVPVEYRFAMPDKSHDTEALAVFPDGRMLVVTKGRSGPVTVFAFPQPLSETDTMMLAPVATLSPGLVQLPEMATGAAVFGNDMFAIRTYGGLQFYRTDADSIVSLYESPYSLDALGEPQGEGVAVRKDGTVFLTSEKSLGGSALLSRLQCELPK
jgi:hypothetical protein